MEEKRQRGEDKVDIPHDIMERIGQQADPSTQTRLGVALATKGESVRLAAVMSQTWWHEVASSTDVYTAVRMCIRPYGEVW